MSLRCGAPTPPNVDTRKEGLATAFVAWDHLVGDLVGIHAARPGTRFEALEPIHQGIREHGVRWRKGWPKVLSRGTTMGPSP